MKKIQLQISLLSGLLLCFLLTTVCHAGEPESTVAVAADSQEITGQVSGVAARAPYFLFFDTSGNLIEAKANPFADAAGGGASGKATDFLSKNRIGLIIAGKFGKKMKTALKEAEIKYTEQQGTVVDTVKEVIHVK